MITILFTAVAVLSLAAAAYWARRRRAHRTAGAGEMCALLIAWALAFVTYTPVLQEAVDSVVPNVSRLLSNSATMTGSTLVLVFLFQLNLEPEVARHRTRIRLALLGVVLVCLIGFFAAEHANPSLTQFYVLYLFVYAGYFAMTVKDFLIQVWKQARSSRRKSQRIGLRIVAAGCVFSLLYAGYKLFVLISLGLGLGLITAHHHCSEQFTVRCTFSVTAPVVSALLIVFGLTLPAVVWPISQYVRKRWEAGSFAALGPLWDDMSTATPEIVLDSTDPDDETNDPDFALHRRVIEINDGVLALHPYRALEVQTAAQGALAALDRQPKHPDAIVEAAVLSAAARAKRNGWEPSWPQAPQAPGTSSREGNLRAETEWLLQVSHAYTHSTVRVAADGLVMADGGSQT
ncbi:MAB_1171c family putative transporter [Streptomyces nigrescens]